MKLYTICIYIGLCFFQNAKAEVKFLQEASVEQNANATVPLAAILKFKTLEKTTTTISLSDGDHQWSLFYGPTYSPEMGLPILGMRPQRSHQLKVSVSNSRGETVNRYFTYATPALPPVGDDFPLLTVQKDPHAVMESGWTLVSVRRRAARAGAAEFNRKLGLLLAIDNEGQIVWSYHSPARISGYEVLKNGNVVFLTEANQMVEIDLLGNEIQKWFAKGRPQGVSTDTKDHSVDTTTLHHIVAETTDHQFLSLGSEVKTIDNYYTSAKDINAPRATQKMMIDWALIFNAQGEVTWKWNFLDYLDINHVGYTTFDDYWTLRGFKDTYDWAHGNGISYNAQDDSILINARALCAVIKVDRKTKEIRWILGDPTGWGDQYQKYFLKPEGDSFQWFYFQHNPIQRENGNVIVFDNGLFQSVSFGNPVPRNQTYSRAAEYSIDEVNHTVKAVWSSESKSDQSVLSYAMGSVQWLPETQHVLIAYGDLLSPEMYQKGNWGDVSFNMTGWTRISEVTHSLTEPSKKVWDLILTDPLNKIGWTIFSGSRVKQLGPLKVP